MSPRNQTSSLHKPLSPRVVCKIQALPVTFHINCFHAASNDNRQQLRADPNFFGSNAGNRHLLCDALERSGKCERAEIAMKRGF